MKRVAMLIAQNEFRDEEYLEPYRILVDAGFDVTTVSRTAGECTGKLGAVVTADLALTESTQRSWDAVVFVGGGGAAGYFDDTDAHALAKVTHGDGGLIAAICIAPSILAHAGLLEGVTATAYHSRKDDLIAHGAVWSDDPVVASGRIITANGPAAAPGFGEAIVSALAEG